MQARLFFSTRTTSSTTMTALFLLLLLAAPVGAQTLERTRFAGTSNGDPAFGFPNDVPLHRTGLAGFFVQFRGEARQFGAVSTGFFDAYRDRVTPRLEVLFSKDSGRQAFDWTVTRQELPDRPYFGQRVFEVTGVAPKGAGSVTIPLYFPPGTGHPVLQGFLLDVVGEPRRVEEIGVELVRSFYSSYSLRVTLRQRAAFAFIYRVQFTTVMDAYVRGLGAVALRGTRGVGTAFVGNRQLRNPALQGFRLWFDDGRHQLDRLAVEIDTEYVTAWLADGGYDDGFRGIVRFLDVFDF